MLLLSLHSNQDIDGSSIAKQVRWHCLSEAQADRPELCGHLFPKPFPTLGAWAISTQMGKRVQVVPEVPSSSESLSFPDSPGMYTGTAQGLSVTKQGPSGA